MGVHALTAGNHTNSALKIIDALNIIKGAEEHRLCPNNYSYIDGETSFILTKLRVIRDCAPATSITL